MIVLKGLKVHDGAEGVNEITKQVYDDIKQLVNEIRNWRNVKEIHYQFKLFLKLRNS